VAGYDEEKASALRLNNKLNQPELTTAPHKFSRRIKLKLITGDYDLDTT
jgi:hypothetical protein